MPESTSPGSSAEEKPKGKPFFPATHWTLIATINDPANPEAERALNELCQTYLPAIESYLRWWRPMPIELGDPTELATEFLGSFVHRNSLKRVDRNKGRFRSYLVGALRNFIYNKIRDLKKQPPTVELDESMADPKAETEATAAFDQKFVEIVMGRAKSRVIQRFAKSKIAEFLPKLLPYITADPPAQTLRELARELNVTEDLIYQNHKRIRDELNHQLREEVRTLLGPDDDIDSEIRALLTTDRR